MAWGQEDKVAPVEPVVKVQNPSPSAFPEWDAKSKDEVLAEWEARQKLLATAKQREMEFRKYVVSRAFPNAHEGMNTLELNNGYALKANIKYNYKLADNKLVEEGLEKLARIGNQGAFIADRLVSWTPNFLLTEYRELQKGSEGGSIEAQQMLAIISTFLTIEDAAPSLEIKQPKANKK